MSTHHQLLVSLGTLLLGLLTLRCTNALLTKARSQQADQEKLCKDFLARHRGSEVRLTPAGIVGYVLDAQPFNHPLVAVECSVFAGAKSTVRVLVDEADLRAGLALSSTEILARHSARQ